MKQRSLIIPLLLVAACGSTTTDVGSPPALDRPTDVAFACFGDMRVVGSNGTAETSDPLVRTATPLHNCGLRTYQRERPLGQEELEDSENNGTDVDAVSYWGVILQSVPGTVALVTWSTVGYGQKEEQANGQAGWIGQEVFYRDADPLTPGQSSIAVGELPIAIASDRAGCQMITANAGSCDLSIIDVPSMVDEDSTTPTSVVSRAVTNATGQPVLARPAAMVAEPSEDAQPIGVECPAEPEGLVYVAYPQCHLVAAVRAGTGTIEAGVRFNPDGSVEITDGNVSCPAECGDGGTFVDGERPVTLDLVHDATAGTNRMVIGADDSPTLTVVELGPDYLPLAFDRVTLEGDIGVFDVAMSQRIGMGGAVAFDDTGISGGLHQFVYAVADDATVRVADIIGPILHECDTQVDPRYLRSIADVSLLACLPVGDVATPPRRALARTPGIEMFGDDVPTAVMITQAAWNDDMLNPYNDSSKVLSDPELALPLIGYFAFVTTARGDTVMVNVDDDIYADFFDVADPLASQNALGMPHQIRDAVRGRDALQASSNDETDPFPGLLSCATDPSVGAGSPYVADDGVDLLSNSTFIESDKGYVLPALHRILCDGITVNPGTGTNSETDPADDVRTQVPVWELGFPRSPAERDLSFPDMHAAPSESWFVAWEGVLSRDSDSLDIDGPQTRHGLVTTGGGAITIDDPSRPFCSMGAQPYDIAELVGCDPDHGDDDCGVGETCYVHPESVVASGACLPIDEVDALSSRCRDYLISERRYSIQTSAAGEVVAVPRRHVLETTPLDGCVSDQQCQDLHAYAHYLHHANHPFEGTPEDDPLVERTYSCEADPTRQAAVDQCVQTCSDTVECDAGSVCKGGYCLEAVVPPAACVPGVQSYQVRGGDALVVIGSKTGYLHSVISDPTTGACIQDPTANPLLVGRIPLVAPPCTGPDDFTTFAPNPCSTTVQQAEFVPNYDPASETCELRKDSMGHTLPPLLLVRDAQAIRFKNPSLTFHMVDPSYPGDLQCREDRAGTLGLIPTVHRGYQTVIDVTSGFEVKKLPAGAVLPVNVVKGPENSIWVIDEGERVPVISGDSSTRGEVFRAESWNTGVVNSIR